MKHYTRWRRHGDPLAPVRPRAPVGLSETERFWFRVDSSNADGCWPWTLEPMPTGYGRFHLSDSWESVYAHRVAYELTKGPIPVGYEVHHQCRNRLCCNPAHLEALTVQAHRALDAGRTHCPHGHEYTEPNTYVNPKGVKICRRCVYLSNQRSRARKRAS